MPPGTRITERRYEAERGCRATGASAVAVVAPDSLELVKLEHGKPDHYSPQMKIPYVRDAGVAPECPLNLFHFSLAVSFHLYPPDVPL